MAMTMIMTPIMIKYTRTMTMEQQWKKQQASQCHGGSDFAKSPPALMICVHQCVRIYRNICLCVHVVICVVCVRNVGVGVYLCSQKHFEAVMQCNITLHTDNVKKLDVNQHSNTSYVLKHTSHTDSSWRWGWGVIYESIPCGLVL